MPTGEPGAGPEGGPGDELAELRARLSAVEAQEARLAEQVTAGPTLRPAERPPPRHRVRSFLAALLIVPACALTPLGALAFWARSGISDTDRYLATMAPLAEDPRIKAAVTDRVTAEIPPKRRGRSCGGPYGDGAGARPIGPGGRADGPGPG
ncbi:hypothetical protein ACIQOV_40355, partial [Kitasatospora sp. NPDC091257]